MSCDPCDPLPDDHCDPPKNDKPFPNDPADDESAEDAHPCELLAEHNLHKERDGGDGYSTDEEEEDEEEEEEETEMEEEEEEDMEEEEHDHNYGKYENYSNLHSSDKENDELCY